MTRRKVQDDVETGGISLTRDEPGGWPDCCPGGIRREGGVTLNQASMWNAGTCRSDAKGEIQIGGPYEGESTDAGHRGGPDRSSDEGPVMGLERRGRVILACRLVNRGEGGGTGGGSRNLTASRLRFPSGWSGRHGEGSRPTGEPKGS